MFLEDVGLLELCAWVRFTHRAILQAMLIMQKGGGKAMKYAGLTDDPRTRKEAHGNPIDWNDHEFESEEEAKLWKKTMLACGYQDGTRSEGWQFGYTFTITKATKQ